MKILLSEACIFMRTGMHKILSEEGYIVTTADSRQQFCSMNSRKYDIILLDTHLLGTLAFEFAHKLRNDKDKPVLIATYKTANASTVSYPYDGMLRKPFNGWQSKDELLDVIEKGLKTNDKKIYAGRSSQIIKPQYANHLVENGARTFS